MAQSHSPRTIAERARILSVLYSRITASDADPTLIALLDTIFATARDAYTAARKDYQTAAGRADDARKAQKAAEASFDRRTRSFAHSVEDDEGKSSPREVAELLGNVAMSDMLKSTCRAKVEAANELAIRLATRTNLTYDAGCAEDLATAAAALDTATNAVEAAQLSTSAASNVMEAATTAFDNAYGDLVRAGMAQLSATVADAAFPLFTRANPKKKSTAAAPTSTASTTTA